LIVLNFFGFDEGYYPFCSGVIYISIKSREENLAALL
jgi:hypothetical protein